MNEKFPSCFSWYNDTIIILSENEIFNLNSKDYFKEYLYTEYWKQVRQRYFEKFDKICAECPSGTENKIIHLHHKGYTLDYNSSSHKLIFGRERYSDLMPLCEKHHQEKHLRTENGDRVQSSSVKGAKKFYIGFYIGKYRDEEEVKIHIVYTVNQGIKQDRSKWNDAKIKVNVGAWYSIFNWKKIIGTKDQAEEYTSEYDGKSQEWKKQFLIDHKVPEKFINECLKKGYVPKNRKFESDFYDNMAEIN